jgi:hypothetical protein
MDVCDACADRASHVIEVAEAGRIFLKDINDRGHERVMAAEIRTADGLQTARRYWEQNDQVLPAPVPPCDHAWQGKTCRLCGQTMTVRDACAASEEMITAIAEILAETKRRSAYWKVLSNFQFGLLARAGYPPEQIVDAFTTNYECKTDKERLDRDWPLVGVAARVQPAPSRTVSQHAASAFNRRNRGPPATCDREIEMTDIIARRKHRNIGIDVDHHCAHCGQFLTRENHPGAYIQPPEWAYWTGQCWRPTREARQQWLTIRRRTERRPTKDECFVLRRGIFRPTRPRWMICSPPSSFRSGSSASRVNERIISFRLDAGSVDW